MTEHLKNLLNIELSILAEAVAILERSYEICRKIPPKVKYPIEDLDHFEALTSRFARLSDLLVQKIFRIIDSLELDAQGTARDRINRAEKRRLISNAETFIKIRMLRNEIAHEYLPAHIGRIFQKVMEWTPELLDAVERVQQFCQKYHSNNI